MGLLLPVIGWSEQRRKSKYATFQCLQALGYQSLGYTVWLLGYLVVVIFLVFFFSILIPFTSSTGGFDPYVIVGFNIVLVILIFGGIGLYLLVPVIASVSCALGRDFRYPVMGSRLARYLGYDPSTPGEETSTLNEEHEDRWVSAMGHFCIIIPIWGLLSPIMAWTLQGKRSLFVKVQAMQTVVYQVFVSLLSFLPGFVYLFGFMIFFLFAGLGFAENEGTSLAGAGAIAIILFGLLALLIALFIPLFHILGQWAGYRVLKGDDYRYPLLGRWVEIWVHKRASLPVVEELPKAVE
jgi:uncharacterized Tic20 family protein